MVMRLKKKLLVGAMLAFIFLPLVAYAWIEIDKDVPTEKDYAPSDVIEFAAVVNGVKQINVFVCINLRDGLSEEEAVLITGTTFIQVKGEYVWRRLEILTFDDARIKAHYVWGYEVGGLAHVCDVTVNVTMLQISVEHCF